MLSTTIRRTIRAGYLSFKRNGWLSAATVLVTSLVLFVLGLLVFLGAFANTIFAEVESKVDISIYFHSDVPEGEVLAVKKEVEANSEVASVSYTSRERALESFRERHRANALILEALDELGENPLKASLNIRAKNPLNYGLISEFLLEKNYPGVDKINYFENQQAIDRLGAALATVRGGGAILFVFLALVSVLVAFNTIRLAIYTMRDEIGIMRLVGATNWFVRGPFVINGIIYGTIAGALTIAVFFPVTWFAAPYLTVLVPSFNVFEYFVTNFFEFAAIMLISGISLGVISSLISVRRYLKI